VTTPYSFESVIGITHVLKAPQTQIQNGIYYTFDRWESNPASNVLSFEAEANEMTLRSNFNAKAAGRGFGLLGSYYNDPAHQVLVSPILVRVDSVIDLNVGLGSPGPGVDENFMNIRWEGEIEPLFTDLYTFSFISDDGVRLWIDSIQVIDHWFNQAAVESSGQIFLEEGRRYPIQVDFFHDAEAMICKMFWSSNLIDKQIVPSTQLYYETPLTGQPVIQVWPNPVREALSLVHFFRFNNAGTIKVYDMVGRFIFEDSWESTAPKSTSTFDVSGLSPGMYILELESPYRSEVYTFFKL